MQTKHEGVYKGCAQGNTKNKTFPSSEIEEKITLHIIHSNFYWPMSLISPIGYAYYVSFIYYSSHKTWIYFLKGKNEVFSKFKEYKALVENQTERNIKTLWSYNGI